LGNAGNEWKRIASYEFSEVYRTSISSKTQKRGFKNARNVSSQFDK
jgi:hypothetical protein